MSHQNHSSFLVCLSYVVLLLLAVADAGFISEKILGDDDQWLDDMSVFDSSRPTTEIPIPLTHASVQVAATDMVVFSSSYTFSETSERVYLIGQSESGGNLTLSVSYYEYNPTVPGANVEATNRQYALPITGFDTDERCSHAMVTETYLFVWCPTGLVYLKITDGLPPAVNAIGSANVDCSAKVTATPWCVYRHGVFAETIRHYSMEHAYDTDNNLHVYARASDTSVLTSTIHYVTFKADGTFDSYANGSNVDSPDLAAYGVTLTGQNAQNVLHHFTAYNDSAVDSFHIAQIAFKTAANGSVYEQRVLVLTRNDTAHNLTLKYVRSGFKSLPHSVHRYNTDGIHGLYVLGFHKDEDAVINDDGAPERVVIHFFCGDLTCDDWDGDELSVSKTVPKWIRDEFFHQKKATTLRHSLSDDFLFVRPVSGTAEDTNIMAIRLDRVKEHLTDNKHPSYSLSFAGRHSHNHTHQASIPSHRSMTHISDWLFASGNGKVLKVATKRHPPRRSQSDVATFATVAVWVSLFSTLIAGGSTFWHDMTLKR